MLFQILSNIIVKELNMLKTQMYCFKKCITHLKSSSFDLQIKILRVFKKTLRALNEDPWNLNGV